MNLDPRVHAFTLALEERRWENVRLELAFILTSSSEQDINRLVSELTGSLSSWLDILYRTGLHKDGENGEYLTRKLILRVWSESTFECRWALFVSLCVVYDLNVDGCDNIDQAIKSIDAFHMACGIPASDIIELLCQRASSHMLVASSLEPVMQ